MTFWTYFFRCQKVWATCTASTHPWHTGLLPFRFCPELTAWTWCLCYSAEPQLHVYAYMFHMAISCLCSAAYISSAVLAEISLRSPRKLFIFIIKKYIYRIKVSKNKLIKFWKKLHCTSPEDMVCMSHAYDTNDRPLVIRTLVSNVDAPLEVYSERRVSDSFQNNSYVC